MSQQCLTATHLKWVFAVALPMLILYVIGIPALGLSLLKKNRDMLNHPEVMKKYSFLYKGYSTKWYFWETVVLTRKVCLVAILVFFSYNTQIQAIMAVLLCTAGMSYPHLFNSSFFILFFSSSY